ncbi:MAG: penicillin-binding transpeptidase domain-containing protein, partial [Myxococcota bacterium]
SGNDGEHGWRAAQRHRSARLSGRGRATLLVLAGLTLLIVGLTAGLRASQQQAFLGSASSDVAAPPPPPALDVPAEVLARVPVGREALELPAVLGPGVETGRSGDKGVQGRLFERVALPGTGELAVEYTLDAELTREVFRVLRQGRVARGHVILMEPRSGRVLAYASTDPESFPATRAYPAASLVKIITAAAALDTAPEAAALPCRYRGSAHRRLRPWQLDPPRRGREISLREALATSNNACFAQLAVHALGDLPLVEAIQRFGWTDAPAPAHEAGSLKPRETRLDLGKLGCGLAGARITPLHAVQLAGVLAHGELVAPRWVDRVLDAEGRELPLPASPTPRRVVSQELADELRAMLTDTTTRGTARSAFRRRGRPLLGEIRVAGKTGTLSGKKPDGRYEWFVGVAPADQPRIAIATLLLQSDLYWLTSSQVAAQVLRRSFCREGACRAEYAERWLRSSSAATAGVRMPPRAERSRARTRPSPSV